MACSSALAFCISHRENRDEAFLVRELSRVQFQVANGFKYFSDSTGAGNQAKLSDLKEPVGRFIAKLSNHLGVPSGVCLDVFIQFLASHGNIDGASIQQLFMGGRMSVLLNRVRAFYWQERLALCGLFRLALCHWHDIWAPISDVLFAMTTFTSRTELVHVLLSEYQRVAHATELLIKDRNHFGSCLPLVSTLGASDMEQEADFHALLGLHLREQLELLRAILIGVHGLPLFSDSGSSEFTKLLEAFWSTSFGLQPSIVHSFGKHRPIMHRICFLQSVILIRAAHLDASSLFPDAIKVQATDPYPASTRGQTVYSKPIGRPVSSPLLCKESEVHFLSNPRVLSRFLVSLSDLGGLTVHGPLLLLGAVCATSFGTTTSGPTSCVDDYVTDEIVKTSDDFSETTVLVAGQYGHLAIESLKVFAFMNEQLDELTDEFCSVGSEVSRKNYEGEEWLVSSRDQDLVSFCAHVAVFDLLALLTRDIVLWSLDSPLTDRHDQQNGLFGLPNRTAFIRLFSKVLRVVAEYVHLVARSPSSELSRGSSASSYFGAGLGTRLAKLIETLAEGFPHDLSILRLCTALMIPSHPSVSKATTYNGTSENSLVQLVSELVCCMPFLAVPLTSHLSSRLNQLIPWYPQLDAGGDFFPSDEFVLSHPFVVWDNGIHPSPHCTPTTKGHLSKGYLELPAGTHGFVKQDVGLLVWKYNHSIWIVIDHEISVISTALDLLVQNSSVLPHSDPCASSSVLQLEIDHSRLYSHLLRLHEFVRFASACIRANVHVSSCVHTIELIWPLLIRCSQHFAEDTHRSIPLKTSRPLRHNSITSAECSNRLCNLLFNQILPSALHLWSITLTAVCDTDSNSTLKNHNVLLHQVLNERGVVFPRLIRATGSQNQSSPFALTSCYLTDQLSQYSVHNDGCEGVYYSKTVSCFELLSAYLSFTSALLTYAKWLCTFDDSSITRSSPPLSHSCFEVLSGAIFLILQQLPGIFPVEHQSGRRPGDHLPILTERCLLLLTDVLTSNVSTHLSPLGSPDYPSDFLASHITESANYSASTTDPIGRLQKLTLHLLLNNTRTLESVLICSSIPLQTLLTQYEAPGSGVSLSLSPSSVTHSQSFKGRLGRIAWLALSLVHRLLNLERTSIESLTSTAPSFTPVLSALRRYTNPSTHDHYVVTLFSYLQYPYNVWLGRSAISVLKWLVQYSDLDLLEHIGLRSDAVGRFCLQRLASTADDQLTRANLFDLIAETVLCAESSAVCSTNKPHRPPDQFLRLLTMNKSHRHRAAVDDFWWNSVLKVAQHPGEAERIDCFHCCISVLREAQELSEKGSLDQMSILLIRSVSKLIAALYLQDLHLYTTVLESRSDFWGLFVHPLFTLLKTAEDAKTSLSNIENEVCGHIISVIGLALFNSFTLKSNSGPSSDLLRVVHRINEHDSCSVWFRLVNKRIQLLRQAGSDSELSADEQQVVWQSYLSSLHDASCRWKCFFCVQLKFLTRSSEGNSSGAPHSVVPIPLQSNALIQQLLACLLSLAEDRKDHINVGADAFIDQLGTCLTLAVSHHYRQSAVSLDDTKQYLSQIVQLLILFRLSPYEQARHIHAELLACCGLLLRSADRCNVASDTAKFKDDHLKPLRSDILDCALGYLAQLSICTDFTVANELASRQALCLMLYLWDATSASDVPVRLVKTGVLHNLLILLEQYSKIQLGCGICHDIIVFLCRFALTPSIDTKAEVAVGLYPDLDKAGLSIDMDNTRTETHVSTLPSLSGAELIASYANILSQALIWPSTETLLQWIREDETSSLGSDTDSAPIVPFGGSWIAFLSVQLQFLSLLHDLLSNAHHPFVSRLLDTFCSENGTQLEVLLRLWCEPLYALNRDNGLHSTFPPLLNLLQNGVISLLRLRLANHVVSFLWRVLTPNQSLNNSPLACESGLPSVGFNVLFRSAPSKASDPSTSSAPHVTTYGPPTSTAFTTTAFLEAESQVHLCSVLLYRSGFRTFVVRSQSLSSTTAVPVAATTVVTSQLTPTKPFQSPATRPSALAPARSLVANIRDSPQHISVPPMASVDPDCGDEVQLACFVRHLTSCLSLLDTQLPSLGYLSLMSSEELQELRTPIELVFNTPTLEDKTHHLSFGTLISLLHSLQNLVSKVSGRLRNTSPLGSPTINRNRETLLSLLIRARELTLSLLFSQSTLALASARTSPTDKQLLVRELAGELSASCPFGRSSRRSQSFSHRSSTIHSSHSPESRSPSAQRQRANLRDSSPHTPALASMLAAATHSTNVVGNGIFIGDSGDMFGFEQAVERFTDLLRMTL